MSTQSASYLSPKCRVIEDEAKGGGGIIAEKQIHQGELVSVWGGRIVDIGELEKLPAEERHHALQVEEGFYLAVLAPDEPSSYFNHSCNPNVGLRGQIALMAMRDIMAGEEVTFDYAMCDSSPYDEFQCQCGSTACRGRVTGNDWRNTELWERYKGYFSPYLQSRIDVLRSDQTKSLT